MDMVTIVINDKPSLNYLFVALVTLFVTCCTHEKRIVNLETSYPIGGNGLIKGWYWIDFSEPNKLDCVRLIIENKESKLDTIKYRTGSDNLGITLIGFVNSYKDVKYGISTIRVPKKEIYIKDNRKPNNIIILLQNDFPSPGIWYEKSKIGME
jgi:hypothetical protein